MKYSKILLQIILMIFIMGISSCDKHHAKKLSGTYACKINYHYWDITPTTIDCTYHANLEIKQDGKKLKILDYSIPIDSLWKGKEYYEGYVHNFITVKFSDENVYITRSGGGLGGNASWDYVGTKK